MNVLAAPDWSRPFTRFDVWTVVLWVNVLVGIGLVVTVVISLLRDKTARTPANLEVFMGDEELEGPRLERVLGWALFFFAIFAVTLPLYWLHEASRGKGTVAYFEENAIERGEELYSSEGMPKFNSAASLQCATCHGPDGGGGSAPFTYTDPATGVAHAVDWKAPALNTVLYRFSPDEVNEIITLGRPGTPMGSWGLDRKGSGPKNSQSINDLVAYLISIQLPDGTAAEAAQDLAGCKADPPVAPQTAKGQAACQQHAWKTQPELQYQDASDASNAALQAQSDDKAEFAKLACSDVHEGRLEDYEADEKAGAAEVARLNGLPAPTGESEVEQRDAALKAANSLSEDCQKLRLKVRDTPDPTTPQDTIAIEAAKQHLNALQSKNAPKSEIAAAEKALKAANATLDADKEANRQKGCRPDGTAPSVGDAAACERLHRALSKVDIRATNDVAVETSAAALEWATEWRDRRANVTDGQVLFETNCARCHTKNWSIFDPTRSALKPEDFLGAPGGGGSLGFNLRGTDLQRRFPATRGPDGEIVENSGELSHTKFILEGSVFSRPYGIGGRGSGSMPGQCNEAVRSDTTAPKLKYYGCMLTSASTPAGGAPTKLLDTDTSGGIDDAMVEQIMQYERCGLEGSTNTLAAAAYATKCKSE